MNELRYVMLFFTLVKLCSATIHVCHATRYAMLCHVIIRSVILCYDVLCYATLCYDLICYTML